MECNQIFESLKAEFSEDILSITEEGNSEPFITVNPANIVDIMLFLRDEEDMLFDYLSCLSAVDNKDNFLVVYNLYSIKHKHRLTVKAELPRENPAIASVEKVWLSADWHERESWDLMGINFEGHHNLIRILNPYDWEGYPLRKDYVTPEYYHGIKVTM
jgi:NADH-quinone oxidoreductase subunit C